MLSTCKYKMSTLTYDLANSVAIYRTHLAGDSIQVDVSDLLVEDTMK